MVEEEEDASGNDPEAAAAACGDGDGVRAAGVDGFFAADEGGGLLRRAWTVRARAAGLEEPPRRRVVEKTLCYVKRTSLPVYGVKTDGTCFVWYLAGRYLTCRFN